MTIVLIPKPCNRNAKGSAKATEGKGSRKNLARNRSKTTVRTKFEQVLVFTGFCAYLQFLLHDLGNR